MKELILSKAIMHDREIEGIIIKIDDDIPDMFELSSMHDNLFFKDQAEKLLDALYMTLPLATLKEFAFLLAKRIYGEE